MRQTRSCVPCALLLVAVTAIAVDAASHEKFVPLVGFQCGYRNRYQSENGTWVTDQDRYATCMQGKLDILKYCKKAYPALNVTNIVEYAHEVTLADWCKEDGVECDTTHTVRPFRCIVGEFHSEALQVPAACRFNHENGRDACKDYTHWKSEASRLCGQKKDTSGKTMSVRSFAMLEPCGLDLFTGVEFVCCPGEDDAAKALEGKVEAEEKKIQEEDEDDSNYDEDEYEDDVKAAVDSTIDGTRDVYFLGEAPATLAQEHEKYREAIDRIEQKHRVKVNKVMKEWNELDARFSKMKKTDPKGAETFRKEMTNRFQSTVASLEEENRKARKEVDEVHEERVTATMNDKKRVATHAYRQALAESVSKPNKKEVLKTLKTYIRAEEKDRVHTLNRFRHLLRTDTQEAMNIKSLTIHRLRYIDLRINGSISMLRDFPTLEKQIAPIAQEFVNDFRRENTPELTPAQMKELEKYATVERDTKIVEMFEADFRKNHPNAFLNVTMPVYHHATVEKAAAAASDITPTSSAKVLPIEEDSDSEEDNDQYYEDENDEEIRRKEKKGDKKEEKTEEKKKETVVPPKITVKAEVTKVEKSEEVEEDKLKKTPIVKPAPMDEAEDEDDSEEQSEEFEEKEEKEDKEEEKDLTQTELRVDIEPIVQDKENIAPSFYRQERLTHRKESVWPFTASGYVFLFAALVVSVFIVFALFGLRNRRRHIRFVEVDVCSPEERHVNGMQVNGYENPTYSFFDAKP